MAEPTNATVADTLDRYALLLEFAGENAFRIRAYQRASESIRSLDRPIADLRREGQLQAVPGIGAGIAAALAELIDTGVYPPLEDLRRTVPLTLLDLLSIPGVGVKTATRLHRALGVNGLDDLAVALDAGRIRDLPGLGAKTETRIRAGLEAIRRRTGRIRISSALPQARALVAALRLQFPDRSIALAGSIRRLEETVADIDVVVAADATSAAIDAVTALPIVARLLERRQGSLRAELQSGVPFDLHFVDPSGFGTELLRATGSPAHLTLIGPDLPIASTEEEVYAALGLPFIPPDLRIGRHEVEWARSGHLDRLIKAGHINGEFHAHSTWSDGAGTITEMAAAALSRGYRFLGISDHSRSLGVANGLDSSRLAAQRREIDELNRTIGLRIFAASEVEVSRDGTLDFDDDTLAGLDVVIASLHSGLRQPRAALTDRLLRVLANRHVDVVAHPTGRLIEQREGGDFDWDAIFPAAAAAGTALEINADPARLDLPSELAERALGAGCLLTINGDAHHPDGLAHLDYGLTIARRAGATSDRVLNCWPLGEIERWLTKRH